MGTEVAERKEVKAAVQHDTDFAKGVFGTSDNWLMAGQMAQALSESTIVPRDYQGNKANAMVAIEIANRLHTSPLMVMQNLNVIQGKPSWSAQFLIASVNASGKYDTELQYEEETDKQGNPYSCKCFTMKNGRKVDGIKITMDMAKAEGWTSKNGSKWKTMPAVMLRYRAASFFARMNCPELTLGFYTKEEVIDGEFKEYPMEDVQKQVSQEIADSANTEEFLEEEEDLKNTSDGTDAESVGDVPEFMKG